VHPDDARELKARILAQLPAAPTAVAPGIAAAEDDALWPWVAVGLAPAGDGARVAVRLQRDRDRALLPDLGPAARSETEVRVIGRVRALSSTAPADLQRRERPLRPGLSVAHPLVTAGTLGGFVRSASGPAILSNNHVLAASDAASLGDPVQQPGPADAGGPGDRVATLSGFERFRAGAANLVDAAVATVDDGIGFDAGDLPGGPLGSTVPGGLEIDPGQEVEKVGRTTGHTHGRISAVEVDAVAVQYDAASSPQGVHRFDDQVEVEGLAGAFSAGGDSGSVIWRSGDRAAVALLFAGSATGGSNGAGVTFANPLATVLSVLGVEWLSG
jgi:hypothetical protein